jgi:hypothetical protein
VDIVALDQQRIVRAHVADGAQDPQEVRLYDCLAVFCFLPDDPSEELGLLR